MNDAIMEATIIHIGYHKSASTFLQRRVFPNLPVNYVFFAGDKRQYLNMIESAHGFDPRVVRNWVDEEIARKYPASKHAITVLSHEELSGHPHGYSVISSSTTAKNLKLTFPNAKILILIRNQLDYLTSLYTFRVAIKGYETRSFSRFLHEEGEKGLYDHLEFHRLVELYRQLFGAEKVIVLPMELLFRSADVFYRRLFEFIQVPSQTIIDSRPTNVSTKITALLNFWRVLNYVFGQILLLLRKIFGERPGNFPRVRSAYYDLKRKSTGALNKMFARSKRVEIRELAESVVFIERFAKSNLILNKMLDVDLATLGYPIKTA